MSNQLTFFEDDPEPLPATPLPVMAFDPVDAPSSLIEAMFPPDTVESVRAEVKFQRVDQDLATDYRCPQCGYEWSGHPKPNAPDDEVNAVE